MVTRSYQDLSIVRATGTWRSLRSTLSRASRVAPPKGDPTVRAPRWPTPLSADLALKRGVEEASSLRRRVYGSCLQAQASPGKSAIEYLTNTYIPAIMTYILVLRIGAPMARPPILKCRRDLTVTVEKRQSEKIKRYAARVRKSVSQIIREFIDELEDEPLERP